MDFNIHSVGFLLEQVGIREHHHRLRCTAEWSQQNKLIMEVRNTINSNQIVQASCRGPANSMSTDGDGNGEKPESSTAPLQCL